MESSSRPLGGIAALTLGVASLNGAAPTLPEGGSQIPLLEDRSIYSEQVSFVGRHTSVKHTLTVITAIDFALPEEIEAGLESGFFAHLSMYSRHEFSVGWSSEALSDRALRLTSCTAHSGEKPSDRGYKEWIFESADGAVNY